MPAISAMLHKLDLPTQQGWRLGSEGNGARLTDTGLRRGKDSFGWKELERLELVIEPPPFRSRWTWLATNLVSMPLGSYESQYGRVRLLVLRRGVAFQTMWDLGRTPRRWDTAQSGELVRWVASLVHEAPEALRGTRDG